MRGNFIVFIIAFALAFGGGYLYFSSSNDLKNTQPNEAPSLNETNKEGEGNNELESNEDGDSYIDAAVAPLEENSCLTCHSVEALGVVDATTGPDLSQAFINVEGKHGVALDEFLQDPTSAVMSSVISGNPLTDEQRKQIIEALKEASEK